MLRKVVISLIAAGAVVGLANGFSGSTKEKRPLPAAVESVSPRPGDLDLRQVELSADLAPGYTGVLFLDGREIAEDDLHRVDALNSLTLRPQPDSEFRELAPGAHKATVVYWRIGQSREEAASHSWSFTLH